ncbi:MAG: Rrf2 family transcriptional regulator [Bacteroidales bacterium]|nr:Rrf2 family transcriptional regulator [Bacteroidales bacterium]
MSKIINFSEASSLAIHAVVLIAQAKGEAVNVNSISDATGASRNHLAKVMQRLVKHGVVTSMRGPSGGFKLKLAPSEVTLYDVYECIDGPIIIEGCPLDRPICPFENCIMGGIVNKLTNEMKGYLIKETISNFL